MKTHWRRAYCLAWRHPGGKVARMCKQRRMMRRPYKRLTRRGWVWLTSGAYWSGVWLKASPGAQLTPVVDSQRDGSNEDQDAGQEFHKRAHPDRENDEKSAPADFPDFSEIPW
jgi:hypothetical protein